MLSYTHENQTRFCDVLFRAGGDDGAAGDGHEPQSARAVGEGACLKTACGAGGRNGELWNVRGGGNSSNEDARLL